MGMAKIPMVRPELPERAELETLVQHTRGLLASGKLTNGDCVQQLERAVERRLSVEHCVALSSCTSGLMLAMRALQLSGEIILPSFTFSASGQALLWNGLRPVFVDCDREKLTIDPAAVRRAITPRTSAILAVHVFGNPAPVAELSAIAREYDLRLIYDAAHGFGASANGRNVGGFGDAEVFSLSPTKLLVGAEGGLVTTNDGRLAEQLRCGRNYGNRDGYDPTMLGLSARLAEWNAALALRGLGGFESRIAARSRIAAIYRQAFEGVPGLCLQRIPDGSHTTWKDFSLLIDTEVFGASRDEVRSKIANQVDTRTYFDPALHRQRIFSPFSEYCNLPNTDWVSQNILSLPIYSRMGEAEARLVANAILEVGAHRGIRSARVGVGL